MSKTITQFRYYGDNNERNQPENILKENICILGSNNIFINDDKMQELGMITHIGIQALPGTEVFINQNKSPVIIGNIGIFELDLTDYSYIHSLYIKYESAERIEESQDGYLIIDVIYDTEV